MHLRPTLSAVSFLLLCASPAVLAGTKDYQVTGPVVSVSDTMIEVQKGKSTWEITRTSATKAPTELKVGDDVTIQYTMTALSVTPKVAKTKAEPKVKASPAESKTKAAPAESPAASPAKPAASSPKP